jgi:hypothetical protein
MGAFTRFGARLFSPPLGIVLIAAAVVDPAHATDGPDPMEIGANPSQSVRSFEIYGFAQTDGIHDFQRVDPNWSDAFRPSKIGVDDPNIGVVEPFGANGQSSMSVKQSRFGVKGTMPTGDSYPAINFKFEFDLFGVGSNAGQTTFRLRHVFGEWGSLLAGQTNSLFMDIDVFPNTIDYWGPSGMVFLRNPQFRWTPYKTDSMHFAIALEKPGNDIDAGNTREIQGIPNTLSVQNREPWPDLTAQWRIDGGWGHFQAAAILRDVGFQYQPTQADRYTTGSQTGWGVNLASGIKTIGKDQLLLQAVYGKGIASYMNDGGMDLAPNANYCSGTVCGLNTEAVPLTGMLAYYDHYWSEKWSSSIGYSFTRVDNTNFQTPATFHQGDYGSVNLLFYPVAKVMIGGEALWGERLNNDGSSGHDWRVQFSVKYDFGIQL